MSRGVNISKRGELRDIRTPVRVEEEDTNTKDKEEEDINDRIAKKSSTQDCLGCCTSSGGKSQAITPRCKILQKILPNISLAGRLKHFYKAENLEQGTQIF